MEITLTYYNYFLYEKVLTHFEGQNITFEDGNAVIDGKVITKYKFRNNYYFFMGDNRHVSNDSRSWGFIPAEYIAGKAILVLYNGNNWAKDRRILLRLND